MFVFGYIYTHTTKRGLLLVASFGYLRSSTTLSIQINAKAHADSVSVTWLYLNR